VHKEENDPDDDSEKVLNFVVDELEIDQKIYVGCIG